MNTINLTADYIDVSDITSRVEALEAEDISAELDTLESLLKKLRNNDDGAYQWRGNSYPAELIADRAFVDHVRKQLVWEQEEVPDCLVIDWQATAYIIQMEYTPIEINGNTYFYR